MSSRLTGRTCIQPAAATLGTEALLPARTIHREKPVRIGVVGGGFGCSFQWHQHPHCEVAAVSDLREDRRERLRRTYACDTVHPNLKALLKDERVNAVAIFTEAPNHVRHCIEAMQAGKDVICAVPAALTLEECARLVDVKRRTGRTYMMAETSVYRHEAIVARELLEKGAFGRLTYCEAEYYHPGIGHADHALSNWNGQRTWRYGYPPMLYPTHTTAFLVGVSGDRLTHVSCFGTKSTTRDAAFEKNDYDNPFVNAAAMFRTKAGNVFRGNVFWQIHAHGERAQWLGEEGALYAPGSGGQPFRFQSQKHGNMNTLPDTWKTLPTSLSRARGHGGSHPHLTHEFVMALVEQREPAIDLAESLAITAPGIVAHQSALQGGVTLEIPTFDGR